MSKSNTSAIKKILAIRTDRFGEFTLTLPAIHSLREAFPDSRLIVMANPYSAQLIEASPDVDGIIKYEASAYSGLRGIMRLVREIRKFNFDAAIIFNPKKDFNIAAFLARIPLRIGYNRKWGFLLNRRMADLKYLGLKHEVEYNFDLIKLIGVLPKKIIFPVMFSKNEADYAKDILSKAGAGNVSSAIAIHPWTSDPIKQWPIDFFIQLARMLAAEFGQKMFLIGGKDEETLAADFIKRSGISVINLVGRLTLRQLAALLKECRLLVSGDSGPVHVACAVGTPVAAIFRNDIPGKSPRRWGPWGEGNTVIEKNNLTQINAQEVFNRIKEISSR